MEGVAVEARILAQTNRQIELFLQALRERPRNPSVTAESMAATLAEVVRAGQWLNRRASDLTGEASSFEIKRFRSLLEQLRDELPALHAHLLTERTRLESERIHLQGASAWANSITK